MMQALLQATCDVKELCEGYCTRVVVIKHAENDIHVLQEHPSSLTASQRILSACSHDCAWLIVCSTVAETCTANLSALKPALQTSSARMQTAGRRPTSRGIARKVTIRRYSPKQIKPSPSVSNWSKKPVSCAAATLDMDEPVC